jgi:hypothetical protein
MFTFICECVLEILLAYTIFTLVCPRLDVKIMFGLSAAAIRNNYKNGKFNEMAHHMRQSYRYIGVATPPTMAFWLVGFLIGSFTSVLVIKLVWAHVVLHFLARLNRETIADEFEKQLAQSWAKLSPH